jgi:UDP-2,3-diacylglucosamine hydrolase
MSNRITSTVLFVADSHFHLRPDAAERNRLERFLAFLNFSRRATDLVLLGDIFDFWFAYPHFRLDGYEELLLALDVVRAAGTRLHFVGGNHDIWAAQYLRRRYGTTGDGEAVTLGFGTQRVRLDHGDGFLARGMVYRSFRALVRRRGAVLGAKALHPELLYAFSTWLSGTSRMASRDEVSLIERRARERLVAAGDAPWDLLVIGHVHHPFVTTHAGRTLACLAGWLQTEGYGLLHHDRFDLLDFARDPLPDLPPSDLAGDA